MKNWAAERGVDLNWYYRKFRAEAQEIRCSKLKDLEEKKKSSAKKVKRSKKQVSAASGIHVPEPAGNAPLSKPAGDARPRRNLPAVNYSDERIHIIPSTSTGSQPAQGRKRRQQRASFTERTGRTNSSDSSADFKGLSRKKT